MRNHELQGGPENRRHKGTADAEPGWLRDAASREVGWGQGGGGGASPPQIDARPRRCRGRARAGRRGTSPLLARQGECGGRAARWRKGIAIGAGEGGEVASDCGGAETRARQKKEEAERRENVTRRGQRTVRCTNGDRGERRRTARRRRRSTAAVGSGQSACGRCASNRNRN